MPNVKKYFLQNLAFWIFIPFIMGQYPLKTIYVSTTHSGCNLSCAGDYNQPFDSIINALVNSSFTDKN